MSESEYGRGYATCLRQFVNHRQRLTETIESYRQMYEPDRFSDNDAVEMPSRFGPMVPLTTCTNS